MEGDSAERERVSVDSDEMDQRDSTANVLSNANVQAEENLRASEPQRGNSVRDLLNVVETTPYKKKRQAISSNANGIRALDHGQTNWEASRFVPNSTDTLLVELGGTPRSRSISDTQGQERRYGSSNGSTAGGYLAKSFIDS